MHNVFWPLEFKMRYIGSDCVAQWLETNRKVSGSNPRQICPVFEIRTRSEKHLD